MEEKQILGKLKQCEADLKTTKSIYRKRDLEKYRKRLLNELRKIRRKKGTDRSEKEVSGN